VTDVQRLKIAFTDSLLALEKAQMQHEQVKRALMQAMDTERLRTAIEAEAKEAEPTDE